jgi:hypothetical protein
MFSAEEKDSHPSPHCWKTPVRYPAGEKAKQIIFSVDRSAFFCFHKTLADGTMSRRGGMI